MNVGLCKVSDFCGCARGVAAAFLLLLSILTVGVKTGAGGVGWKLGAFDEKAPAFGRKRGAVGEKAATSCSLWAYDRALGAKRMAAR